MDLREDEERFLESRGYSKRDVLDARFLSAAERKERLKHGEYTMILGSQCGKAGHRLRSRAGHCVQCDTSKLAYQERHSAFQFLYVAESFIKGYMKVGVTKSVYNRERSLCSQRYGGASDWRIRMYTEIMNAGRVEETIKRTLSEKSVSPYYIKNNRSQEAQEVFSCSYSEMEMAVSRALAAHGLPGDLNIVP